MTAYRVPAPPKEVKEKKKDEPPWEVVTEKPIHLRIRVRKWYAPWSFTYIEGIRTQKYVFIEYDKLAEWICPTTGSTYGERSCKKFEGLLDLCILMRGGKL